MVLADSALQEARKRLRIPKVDFDRYKNLLIKIVQRLEVVTGELGEEEMNQKHRLALINEAVKCINTRREIQKEMAEITRLTEKQDDSLGDLISK